MLSTLTLSAAEGRWAGSELGIDIQSWDYREFSDGAELMRDYGTLIGAYFDWRSNFASNQWQWQLYADYLTAMTQYDGQLQDGTPYSSDSKNKIFTTLLRFERFTGPVWSTIWGVGYRHLRNEELPDEPADYSRSIDYLYLPLGFAWYAQWGHQMNVRCELIYNLFLSGSVQTELSQVGYAGDIKNFQGKGYGLHLELKMWEQRWSFTFYYDYWSVEDSESDSVYGSDGKLYTFIEPENTTKSLGLKVGITF